MCHGTVITTTLNYRKWTPVVLVFASSCSCPSAHQFSVRRQFLRCSQNMLTLSFFVSPLFFFLLRLLSLKLRWGQRKSRWFLNQRRSGYSSEMAFCSRFSLDVSTAIDPRKKGINFYVIAGAFKQNDCSLHKVKDGVSEVFFFLLFLLDCLSIIGVIDTDANERWNKVSLG